MESSLSCNNCLRLYTSQITLRKHQKKCRTSELKFKCKHCNKLLSSKQNRKEHEFTHTGELPYICKAAGCGLRFRQGSVLSSHKRVHITIEKYITQESCNWIKVIFIKLTDLIRNKQFKPEVFNVECKDKVEIPLITKPQMFVIERNYSL